MAQKYRRPDKGDFSYKLILGVFILALLMGMAGVIYFGMHYRSSRMLFWAFLIWTAFYAVTIYGWTDEERYAKYEHYMIPVMFGVLFVLLVALCVAGLVINVPKLAAGEDVLTNLLATIIGEGCLGAFAFITYKYFLKEYIDRLLHK